MCNFEGQPLLGHSLSRWSGEEIHGEREISFQCVRSSHFSNFFNKSTHHKTVKINNFMNHHVARAHLRPRK